MQKGAKNRLITIIICFCSAVIGVSIILYNLEKSIESLLSNKVILQDKNVELIFIPKHIINENLAAKYVY